MTDYYFGEGGDNSTGDGSVGNPWLTEAHAISNSTADDTLILIDGTAEHPSTHDSYLSPRQYDSASFRQGILQSADGQGFTCRTGGTAAAGTYKFYNRHYQSKDVETKTIQIGNSANNVDTEFFGCQITCGSQYGIVNFMEKGTHYIGECKLTGEVSVAAIATSATSANDGDQTFIVRRTEIDFTSNAANAYGIQANKDNSLTNAFNCEISGMRIIGVGGSSQNAIGVQCNGVAEPLIAQNYVKISNENSGEAFCIQVEGKSTAVTSDAQIQGNECEFYCPQGYAIALGDSTSDSYVTGGLLSGNKVTGKYYASDTPHLLSVGQGVTAEVAGNTISDGYVPFLISKTTNATVKGNVAFNPYGSAYYVKGATDCTIRHNYAVLTGKYVQRDRGIFAVVAQGATNTAAATITNNVVIVVDADKIDALAQIATSQVCTYSNNLYYIPDSVDLSTANLFKYKTTSDGDAANYTYAQWLAATEVTDDKIIQLPASQLALMAQAFNPEEAASVSAFSHNIFTV